MSAKHTELAILVGLIRPEDPALREPPLEELSRLAETAGALVGERVVQKRPRAHPATFVGKGKAQEIKEVAEALDADLVIFDHDLSPAQGRNLEKIVERRVIDRSELILDIFARRARSRQARVQVELAQLEYLRPRLRRMWTHLDREAGIGAGMGIGMRGPGEKQIEMDRRIVGRQIQRLKKELVDVERQHRTRSSGRKGYFNVSLVGYTNAGKSTLLQALTGAETLIEDKLFATLDTTTRAWEVDGNRRVFLSDTVGFIRGLPHHLVASFHATLEEARDADLLLHVVDASNLDADMQLQTVRTVLSDVGADDVPVVTVLNKVDRLADRLSLALLVPRSGKSVVVSATEREGLDDLAAAVLEHVESLHVELDLRVHAGDGKLLAFLAEKGTILSQDYREDGEVILRVSLPRRFVAALPQSCLRG